MNNSVENAKENTVQTFEIAYEYDLYSIGINKSKNEKQEDCINFTCFNKNQISNISYQNLFNLEQLLKVSDIFKLCNNIDDALNIIIQTFKSNEVKIKKDENINLCISMKSSNNNQNEVKITLEKVKIKDSAVFENLFNNLAIIQEKNKSLEEEIKLLKSTNQKLSEMLNKNQDDKLIDVIAKKFMKSKYTLSNDLSSHLKDFGLNDDYKKEIINKFESKAKVIYDVKKDGDTIVSFMLKVFGKSNIAAFYALHDTERYINVQIGFLNGKLEIVNNYFDFEKNDLFTYGNYQTYEGDYCFTSFKAQNSRVYIKVEFECIYVIFYENENINFVAKIRDNFVNNPVLYLEGHDSKVTSFFEENPDDKVNELFNTVETSELNLTELIIYQVGE